MAASFHLYHVMEMLEKRLSEFRRSAETFDHFNTSSIEDLAPEFSGALAGLTEEINYFAEFFAARSHVDPILVKQVMRDFRGIHVRSAMPLPLGRGIQLNLGDSVQSDDQPAHSTVESDSGQRINVAVYLDTNDDRLSTAILNNVDNLVSALGYGAPEDVDTRRGSIFRRSWSKIRKAVTSEEVKSRVDQAGRALELQGLVLPQAEADFKVSQAVGVLMQSISDVPNACLHVGTLFLVKYQTPAGSVVLTRTLSLAEVRALEKYPEIANNPSRVLDALSLAVNSWQDDLPPTLDGTNA